MTLSTDQMIELEIRVQDEITRLKNDIESSGEDRKAIAPDRAIGRISRLDSMLDQQMAMNSHQRRQERLALLENTIRKMDYGTYGTCERCGREIAFERLKEIPETRHCRSCG